MSIGWLGVVMVRVVQLQATMSYLQWGWGYSALQRGGVALRYSTDPKYGVSSATSGCSVW